MLGKTGGRLRIGSPAIDAIDATFCYLTTTGRRTGKPHTIEIWFAAEERGSTLYLLSGGRDRADWVRNLRVHPEARVRIGRDGPGRAASARVLEGGTEEDGSARRLVLAKYQTPGTRDLESFGRQALAVALDLVQDEGDDDDDGTRTSMTM